MVAPAKKAFLCSLGVAAALAVWLAWRPFPRTLPASAQPLLVYCGAGLKPPVERVAREFTRRYGVEVQLQFGGSGTLLSNLRVARRGDLYLAADHGYVESARRHALVAEVLPLARLKPVLAVKRGNPKGVRRVADLTRPEVVTALANPEATAIGRAVRDLLTPTDAWTALAQHTRVFKPTVNDVANDIKLGAVDAGVVWDVTARQYPELEMIEDPVLSRGRQDVTIAVLACSEQPTAALRFARYLGAADAGLLEFQREGYEVVTGDRWAEQPEVVLYSGGVNRLALEPVLQRFEAREGVRVTRVYNGCGILVAQMKAGHHPDAYLACDVSFHTPVQDLFAPPVEVSETDIVLVVKPGNPSQLQTLASNT